MLRHSSRLSPGFTLLELVVVMAVIGLLAMVGAPSLSDWIRSTRVRTTAESLHNGLRMAQAEAIRQGRQVVFVFTNQAPAAGAVAVVNGINWSSQTVPLLQDDEIKFIRGGNMADVNAGVAVDTDGQTAVCFDPSGARVSNPAPGPVGAVCSVTAPNAVFNVRQATNPASAKSLGVMVSLGGRIRMCDMDKSLSAKRPDGSLMHPEGCLP